jgi:hypothetical protein
MSVCNVLTLASLSDEVRINRGTRVQIERRDRLLMHLVQHQIHHRGQAHAMLSGTRIKPPQLDEFFPVEEAPLRASELTTWAGQRKPCRGGPTLSRGRLAVKSAPRKPASHFRSTQISRPFQNPRGFRIRAKTGSQPLAVPAADLTSGQSRSLLCCAPVGGLEAR